MKVKISIFIAGMIMGLAVSYFFVSKQWAVHHDVASLTDRGKAMVAIADLLSESARDHESTIASQLEGYVCDEYRRQKSISSGAIDLDSYGLSDRGKVEGMKSSTRYVLQAEAYNSKLVERCGQSL
ncbi:hypothetical protein Mag101_11905 [Microbulbifer agarilyticus]|uniref:Uncharacterized protein n=1 Tax=Microbulbifer agarilyticus TaxID=260552 RepID=A0A1Q2M7J3_9GAMM|nr:hypothetical protein [Microbulbifer agarilyticus]AQQ68267.1 hypothetical protein Mag101_11905 [Microbulbifer agarilyticus]